MRETFGVAPNSQNPSHTAYRGRKGIGVAQISKWGVCHVDLVALLSSENKKYSNLLHQATFKTNNESQAILALIPNAEKDYLEKRKSHVRRRWYMSASLEKLLLRFSPNAFP